MNQINELKYIFHLITTQIVLFKKKFGRSSLKLLAFQKKKFKCDLLEKIVGGRSRDHSLKTHNLM